MTCLVGEYEAEFYSCNLMIGQPVRSRVLHAAWRDRTWRPLIKAWDPRTDYTIAEM
jgi:hypothetical protein